MFREAQNEVDKWIKQFKIEYFPILDQHALLTEEVGELAREINHNSGIKTKKPGEKESSISEELADILFVVMCIANGQGISLEEAFEKNMDKKYGRDNNRYERKDEINK